MIRYLLVVVMITLASTGFIGTAFAGTMDDLLISSVNNNNIAMAKTAVANGADVNYLPNKYSTTALTIAVQKNNPELIQFLLKNGADINLPSRVGNLVRTPLSAAILSDNAIIAQQLVKSGADVNFAGKDDYSPLTLAINTHCNFQIVSLLISKNANVNLEKNGYTPLMAAARYQNGWGGNVYKQNKLLTAKLLLKSGADPSFVNYRNNKTALQYAIDTNFVEMINLLLPISPK